MPVDTKGCETCQMRRIPILFLPYFGSKGWEITVFRHFPILFWPLQPQKGRGKQPIERISHPSCFREGWEYEEIQQFPILRFQGRDGKCRKNDSFPSFIPGSWIAGCRERMGKLKIGHVHILGLGHTSLNPDASFRLVPV